jgi:hypothetical protein
MHGSEIHPLQHHTDHTKESTMFSAVRTFITDHALIIGITLAILTGWLLAFHFTAPAVAVTQTIEAPVTACEFDPTALFDQ